MANIVFGNLPVGAAFRIQTGAGERPFYIATGGILSSLALGMTYRLPTSDGGTNVEVDSVSGALNTSMNPGELVTIFTTTGPITGTAGAGRVRNIGQRNCQSTNLGGGLPYMVRFFEHATEDIRSIGLDFSAWVVSGVETALAGQLHIYGASVEYPAGTFTPLTFGGSPTIDINGGNDGVGDLVPCQFIPKGAQYWIRFSWQGDSQVPYTGGVNGNNQYVPGGDAIEQTAVNKCLSGTVNDSGIGIGMYPTVLKGYTAKQIPADLGDSREAGANETTDATGIVGSVAQAISTYTAFLRLGVSGESLVGYLASSTRREAQRKKYTDFQICAFGINDLYGAGQTPAQLATSQQTQAARSPTQRYYCTTLAPETTSTDNWATLANQTLGAQNANVIAYNGLVVGGIGGGVTSGLDIRAAFESTPNSGKWVVTGVPFFATADGVHPSRAVNATVVIPAAAIGL